MATRGALIEIGPALYQRGQTLTWPRHQKLELLTKHNIHLVINLWVKVDPDLSDACRYVNWPIPGDRVTDDLDDLVEVGARSRRRGRGVLVHCEAGQNRSALVCALILVRTEGMSGPAAWQQVASANPAAKLRPALHEYLMAR